MLDKLRVMFDVAYISKDFKDLRMYKLNSDQLLALLKSTNFIGNADSERLVDCLKGLQKGRELKLYKDRPEIMNAVRKLSNH